MLRNVLDNRMAVIGAVVALSLILSGSVVGIHSAISAEGDAWPAFTMTYEVDGTAIGVGDATYQGREVHRLEYRTGKDWVDTVIAAPSVDTVAGPVSAVGSYQRLSTTVADLTGGVCNGIGGLWLGGAVSTTTRTG